VTDRSLTGRKVAWTLSLVVAERSPPAAITVDIGSEFYIRTVEAQADPYV
jgi:hypothetical protein